MKRPFVFPRGDLGVRLFCLGESEVVGKRDDTVQFRIKFFQARKYISVNSTEVI